MKRRTVIVHVSSGVLDTSSLCAETIQDFSVVFALGVMGVRQASGREEENTEDFADEKEDVDNDDIGGVEFTVPWHAGFSTGANLGGIDMKGERTVDLIGIGGEPDISLVGLGDIATEVTQAGVGGDVAIDDIDPNGAT